MNELAHGQWGWEELSSIDVEVQCYLFLGNNSNIEQARTLQWPSLVVLAQGGPVAAARLSLPANASGRRTAPRWLLASLAASVPHRVAHSVGLFNVEAGFSRERKAAKMEAAMSSVTCSQQRHAIPSASIY